MPAPLKPLTSSSKDPMLNTKPQPSGAEVPKLFSAPSLVWLIIGVIALFISVQQVAVYLFAPLVLDDLPSAQGLSLASDNGTVISYALLLTLLLMTVTIIGIIKGRILWVHWVTTGPQIKKRHRSNVAPVKLRYHYRVRDYLALKPFSIRVAIALVGLWLLYWGIGEAFTSWLNKDPTQFVDVLYASAQPKWLLVVVIVIVAPCYEELMFRGVLWSGLKEQITGQGGVWLASIVTSGLFAIIHLQYDTFEMGMIFCLAMLMSYARYKSGSLWLPLLIHIINNGVAMGQYLLFK